MNGNTRIGSAFLIGGAIGAFLALLFAPKSGKKMRRDISTTARRMKKDAVDLVDDTIESIHGFVGDVRDRAEDLIESGVDMSENAKKEVVKALESGQKAIEKQKKRVIAKLGL